MIILTSSDHALLSLIRMAANPTPAEGGEIQMAKKFIESLTEQQRKQLDDMAMRIGPQAMAELLVGKDRIQNMIERERKKKIEEKTEEIRTNNGLGSVKRMPIRPSSGAFSVGDQIVGSTSRATASIMSVGKDHVAIENISGDFRRGEIINNVGGTASAVVAGKPTDIPIALPEEQGGLMTYDKARWSTNPPESKRQVSENDPTKVYPRGFSITKTPTQKL